MIIVRPRIIVRRPAAGVNSIPVISWDIGCPDIDNRIIARQHVAMWTSGVRHSLCCLLDDADSFVGQAVELVDELVDLLVSGVDLALDERFFVIGLGGGELSV